MATTITDTLQGITPRMINVEQGNGTLSRASISALTPQAFEDLDNQETRMEKIIEQTKEARMCGAKQHALEDLFLSRMVPLQMPSMRQGPSVIAPFDLIPQRTRFNFNYFTVTGGVVAAHTGVTIPGSINIFQGTGVTDLKMSASATTGKNAAVPYSGSTTAGWVLTVTAGPADDPAGNGISATNFNLEGVKDLGAYFTPGNFICVQTDGTGIDDNTSTTPAANYAASAAYTVQYKIIGAYSYEESGVQKAKVVVVPSMTAAQFVALSAAEKDQVKVVAGGGCILANSVSDYESYHEMPPAVNPTHLNAYWDQTFRWSDEINEEYVKGLNAALTTSFWKKFKTLDVAQQRRVRYDRAMTQWFNTLFWGQPLKGQHPNTYTSLEQVKDLLDSNMIIEYKSNTVGIKNQLAAFNRVHNVGGGGLNMDTLFEACYQLSRNREFMGGDEVTIEGMTDRHTASMIQQFMARYYKQRYGFSLEHKAEMGKKVHYAAGDNNLTMWEYDVYPLPDQGINLCIIKDRYFEDHVAAMPAAQKNRARSIIFADWRNIQIGIKSNRSVRRTNNIYDNLYNHVIQRNDREYLLNSRKFQVRVNDPNSHMIVENFSLAAPTATTIAGGVNFN